MTSQLFCVLAAGLGLAVRRSTTPAAPKEQQRGKKHLVDTCSHILEHSISLDRRSVSDMPEPKIPRIPHMICGGVLNTRGFLSFEDSPVPAVGVDKGRRITRVPLPETRPPDLRNLRKTQVRTPIYALLGEDTAPATARNACQAFVCAGQSHPTEGDTLSVSCPTLIEQFPLLERNNKVDSPDHVRCSVPSSTAG